MVKENEFGRVFHLGRVYQLYNIGHLDIWTFEMTKLKPRPTAEGASITGLKSGLNTYFEWWGEG